MWASVSMCIADETLERANEAVLGLRVVAFSDVLLLLRLRWKVQSAWSIMVVWRNFYRLTAVRVIRWDLSLLWDFVFLCSQLERFNLQNTTLRFRDG